jgi:hypothetical protein
LLPQSNKAEWHLTYRCDLHCVHCNRLSWLPPQTPDMTIADAEEFCRQALALDWRPRIVLIGGEPTLHPQFFDFLALAARFHPGGVEVWSNGYSHQAREALAMVADLGTAVVIDHTRKPRGSIVQPADDLFLAPADFGHTRGPCQCHASQVCGVSVDAGGYTLCAQAGAMDGILKLGIRTRRLADLFDEAFAAEQTMKMCRWCGHALGIGPDRLAGSKPLHGSRMSATWSAAVERIEAAAEQRKENAGVRS